MSEPKHDALAPADLTGGRRLAPVVEEAMRQSQTAETIAALLDVQERWEAGQARKAFSRALVELKACLPSTVEKDAKVDFGKGDNRVYYRHTTLAAMMDVVDLHLPQHGFAMTWSSAQDERGVIAVTCRLLHEDGHSEETTLVAPPDKSGSKGPAQAVASTVTYLRRYTAMMLLGLASRDLTEPHGPQPAEVVEPESVDGERNRKAAAEITRRGLRLYDAEETVGRSVAEWTAADLDTLRQWVREQRREPGEEG